MMYPTHSGPKGPDMCDNTPQNVSYSSIFEDVRLDHRPLYDALHGYRYGNSSRNHADHSQRRPCKTWVAICYDESSGEVLEESSPNMRSYRKDILLEAKQKFREHIVNEQFSGKIEENTSVSRSQSRMSRRGKHLPVNLSQHFSY